VTFLRLAIRNIMRNARRSAITVAAIAVGMAALLFLWSFIDGVNEQMIDNSTRLLSGHLQVHRSGYHDEQTLDLLLPDPGPAADALKRSPEVQAVSTRLEGGALASVGEKSRAVLVIGVDPKAERAVTTLAETVALGEFLDASDPSSVVLGARIAEALGAAVGGEVVLVTQAADGSVGAGRYRVKGIFRTRMDMLDGAYVLLSLPAAQELFATGDGVTSLVARLRDRGQVDALQARQQASLGSRYEVLGWAHLLPAVVQSVAFHEVMGYILLLVLFTVVAVGITNTVLMAVLERTREFGVMMALGTARAQITRLVFYEALLLGLIGLAAGAIVGGAIVFYYARTGMDFGRYVQAMQTMQGLTSVIYPLPRLDRALLVSLLVLVIGVVASVYPAWRAARLAPVAAIRGLPPERSRRSRQVRTARQWSTRLPLLVRIAGRGLGRNPHRTALTMAASAIGVAAFVFVTGIADGYLRQMVENSTGYVTGHLQVQHPRFRVEMDGANSLSDTDALLSTLRKAPEVLAAAPRVQTMALATSAGQSQNFTLVGIDPAAEREVTFMHRAVKGGRMLESEREIVLGDRLAEKLGLRLGDKVVIMAQAADGSVGSAAYRLAGLFDTGSDSFDALLGYVSLPAAQSLLAARGRLSTIAVRLRDPDELASAQARLASLLPPGPVLVSWRELLPEVDQMIAYLRVVLRLITGIVLGVVAIGVMNTMLMSVMERTRELGIMLAVGTRPRTIVALVMCEALVLALAGIVAGWTAGIPLVQYLALEGLDVSFYAKGLQSIPGLTGVIYPAFVPLNLVSPSLVLLVLSLAAALYPAWRAARLQPAAAIRHA
jgi:putative ABC transport system permease protein